MNEFKVSNDIVGDAEGLRRRAAEDGYLFFKGLIDRKAVFDVRSDICALLDKFGWLKGGTDPLDAIAGDKKYVEPEPDYLIVYNEILKLERFHSLAHDKALVDVYDLLFGEKTLVHPRNIARIIFPDHEKFTTPAHQDYIHIQGTPETWTAWIPLVECPKNQGSLVLMRGSHRKGIFPTLSAYGAGGLGIDTSSFEYEWVGSDFELGDVVTFHSHTIHKALPNATADRLRLSVDFRYQGVSQPVVEGSLMPHHAQLTWDEIYKDWKSDKYQFYWRELPLAIADWSPKFHTALKDPPQQLASK